MQEDCGLGNVAIATVIKVASIAAIISNWRFIPTQPLLESFLNQETIPCYFLAKETSRLVADLPNTLPPPYFPVNPGGVVNVPPVKRPERAIPSLPSSVISPATLPSTNQPPSVSVPSLESNPRRSRSSVTTSQPVEDSDESVSPPSNSSPVIEFGQPLPKT